MRYQVEGDFRVRTPAGPLDPEDLDAHLDQVLEALYRLEAADADYDASLTSGKVCIRMVVEAGGDQEAIGAATQLLRQALQEAGARLETSPGGPLPGHPTQPVFDQRSLNAEPIGA